MTQQATYPEKLRDPRWQKIRLQVMERDDWKCAECGDKRATLHVHHIRYEWGKEPWEYPIEALKTLCEFCHELEHEIQSKDLARFQPVEPISLAPPPQPVFTHQHVIMLMSASVAHYEAEKPAMGYEWHELAKKVAAMVERQQVTA